MTPTHWMILHAWVSRNHFRERCQNPVLTRNGIQQRRESWKSETFSDSGGLMTIYERKYFCVYMFWHNTIDILRLTEQLITCLSVSITFLGCCQTMLWYFINVYKLRPPSLPPPPLKKKKKKKKNRHSGINCERKTITIYSPVSEDPVRYSGHEGKGFLSSMSWVPFFHPLSLGCSWGINMN